MKRCLSALILVIACSFDLTNAAEGEHSGFLFRMNLGPSFVNYVETGSSYQDDKYTGDGIALMLSLGGSFNPNVSGGFEINVSQVANPSILYQGVKLATTTGITLVSVSMGPMISYNIMPINIYFTGCVGLGQFQLHDSSNNLLLASSKHGLSLSFSLGKEWHVSKSWGLGVSTNYQYITTEDVNCTFCKISGSSASLLFSATYN